MTAILISDLTASTVDGTGVFDTLMKANKAHLEAEFKLGRIKGSEYATVYLGAMDTVMTASLTFLLQRQKVDLESQLLAQQILVAQIEVQKATTELAILDIQKSKLNAELAQITAQTALTTQQTANAVIEGTVLTATECKLRAEYDLTVSTTLKSGTENSLMLQKVITEKAQTLSVGVDDNSVIGKQKSLYTAQTAGFARNAEQQAAQLMVGTWNARRMTDEATVADGNNMLNDVTVGRAINKLLAGVGA